MSVRRRLVATLRELLGESGLPRETSKGRVRARAWRRAAAACDLTDLKESRSASHLWERVLEGKSGTLRVRLERYTQHREDGTLVVIGGLRHDGGLELRPEDTGTAFGKKLLGRRDIDTGDESFDEELYVTGSPALARAILDAATRILVRRVIQGRIEIAGASPTAFIEATAVSVGNELLVGLLEKSLGPELHRLPGALRTLLDVAQRLALPDDVAERLADNARTDPEPHVRLQNLLTLVREYPKHAATQEALRAACADESDEIRLRAAMALGEEGRKVLLEMASGGELASGRAVDDSWSAGAIAALGEHLSRERAQAILEGALLGRRPLSARACVQVLGRLGGAEVLEPLAKVLLTGRGAVAAEAARALGATGVVAAQRSLLDALERGLPELRVPVAEALGRVGSIMAVLPLKEAETRYWDDKDLRHAARQAIAEIQSRLTGASPGQLSLAQGEGGELSLVESEVGQLSLAEDERGRLSLKGENDG